MQRVGALSGLIATALLEAASAAMAATAAPAQGETFLMQHSQRLAIGGNLSQPGDEKLDYNDETHVGGLPLTVEFFFAALFVCLIASVPAILVGLVGGQHLTKAHKVESGVMLAWLILCLFLFTRVLKFNSSHWTGARPLTLVEAVYLLAQILTTVGYGDITPALPRGQVWVAVNVILALCLYGSLVMEVVELAGQRISKAMAADNESEDAQAARLAGHPLKNWDEPAPPISLMPFMKSLAAFTFFATVGVLFWHLYPGEGKTWLQAIYMSIITLSTVGFGWFNATTEGGKVFGAFWMLFGVASLAAVIGSFVEFMIEVKERERRDENAEKLLFFRYIRDCTKQIPSLGDNGMDSYDFLKFGVLLKQLATAEEVEAIEERWAELVESDGTVSCDKLVEVEGPPESLLVRKAIEQEVAAAAEA